MVAADHAGINVVLLTVAHELAFISSCLVLQCFHDAIASSGEPYVSTLMSPILRVFVLVLRDILLSVALRMSAPMIRNSTPVVKNSILTAPSPKSNASVDVSRIFVLVSPSYPFTENGFLNLALIPCSA